MNMTVGQCLASYAFHSKTEISLKLMSTMNKCIDNIETRNIIVYL